MRKIVASASRVTTRSSLRVINAEELATLNERIRKAHFSAADGPADGVRTVDVEAVVADWKRARTKT